jgi:polyhydroxyalkanoate synthesis regulator phasin
MSIDFTDKQTWQEKGSAAGMLADFLKALDGRPPEAYGEVIADLVAYLKLNRRGTGYLFEMLHRITKYNEASHAQQERTMEVVCTLIDAVKEQDRQIKRLAREVEALQKKNEKLSEKVAKKSSR